MATGCGLGRASRGWRLGLFGRAATSARRRLAVPSPVRNRTDVLARPTGFNRADAMNVRIVIDGAAAAAEEIA